MTTVRNDEGNPLFDHSELYDWAKTITTQRLPDFTIGPPSDLQVERWFAIPRNPFGNVYIHKFYRSDPDVPHDHPWDNYSLILRGRYIEEFLDGRRVERREGDSFTRRAEDAHRVIVEPDDILPVTTLFWTGPVRRDWGFHCPRGWVSWRDFVEVRSNGNMTGRGCGDTG